MITYRWRYVLEDEWHRCQKPSNISHQNMILNIQFNAKVLRRTLLEIHWGPE